MSVQKRAPMLPGEFCGHCGSYGEEDRFDFGPKYPDGGLDDFSENYELLIQCPACLWWTIWQFDNAEFEKHQIDTGGEGWPRAVRIRILDDAHFGEIDAEAFYSLLYDATLEKKFGRGTADANH